MMQTQSFYLTSKYDQNTCKWISGLHSLPRILRSEGDADVFDIRRWDPDSDEEPDEGRTESGDNDTDAEIDAQTTE